MSAAKHLQTAQRRLAQLQATKLSNRQQKLLHSLSLNIEAATISLPPPPVQGTCPEDEHDFVEECSRCGLDPREYYNL